MTNITKKLPKLNSSMYQTIVGFYYLFLLL